MELVTPTVFEHRGSLKLLQNSAGEIIPLNNCPDFERARIVPELLAPLLRLI